MHFWFGLGATSLIRPCVVLSTPIRWWGSAGERGNPRGADMKLRVAANEHGDRSLPTSFDRTAVQPYGSVNEPRNRSMSGEFASADV